MKMTRDELEKIAGRKAPSEAERRIAARVIVRGRKAQGRNIPDWVKALAQQ